MLALALVLTAACGPCAGPEKWVEPTEVAITAWNEAHPEALLSAECEDRVRGIQFELATQDHIDRECPPTDGIQAQGCTIQFDAVGAIALILDSDPSWRVYAHGALHVAHGCGSAQWGDLDPHHCDVEWQHDPSDALHM